ncbi:Protein of unknown function [Gryllus bimaculatus]|nr:Protein of unknown function [Gryllus bimaculatus]
MRQSQRAAALPNARRRSRRAIHRRATPSSRRRSLSVTSLELRRFATVCSPVARPCGGALLACALLAAWWAGAARRRVPCGGLHRRP